MDNLFELSLQPSSLPSYIPRIELFESNGEPNPSDSIMYCKVAMDVTASTRIFGMVYSRKPVEVIDPI